jgi:exosortase
MLKIETLSQTGMLRASTVAPAEEPRAGVGAAAVSAAKRVPAAVWVGGGLLAALLLALYLRIGIKLVEDWINYQDYSHGPLIPFFAAFLVWDQRAVLLGIAQKPSWFGIPLVVLGLFILLVGVFGADLFLSRISFIILAAGLIWTLAGRAMLGWSKFLLFVLALSIPLPAVLFNHITFPLQILASEVASWMLPWFGVPVLREGNVINLPAMPLEVAEACSGIRSLMSLFTVAVIFGYFVEKGTLRRTILALASVPIAVAANVARIVGTGLCVQYWDPQKALGFFHEFSGWLMFLVSMSLLYVIHRLMARFMPQTSKPQAGAAI